MNPIGRIVAFVLALLASGVLAGGVELPLPASGAVEPAERPAEAVPTLRIINARLIDGTGAPGRPGSLRIVGDRIAAVGDVASLPGEEVFDAKGLVLAPGFIDTHSHATGDLFEIPEALGAVSQGITTVVGGQDGDSFFPLGDYFARLEKAPAAINVASYSGHGTLREKVLGEDFRRVATAAEIERMSRLLDQDMAAGALGLSSGLEYDPGIYSSRGELIDLARVAARYGGRYISHIRSEDRKFWEAIDEILAIGREAKLPVQISHVKLAMRNLWGQAPRLLAQLDQARAQGIDVSADIYPYLYWHSSLTVLFPDRDFENLAEARKILAEIAPAEGLLLGRYLPHPAYAGRTVAEIAKERGEAPEVTLVALIRDAEALRRQGKEDVENVIATSMIDGDLEKLLAWPHTNLCTDGQLDGSHPRGFGSYPRVLGRYVREKGTLGLEEAIRKMTSLAADHVGIKDRGRLAPGAYADLVLFDPAKVIDRATTTEPHALSVGIERVWVNGKVVFAGGAASGAKPGRVLRREESPRHPG
ncbi:MAG TPA: D-aminoacylase [Thermoanaerobaculia bacterium]|nr:D-aminoacylase [Thermoanaerobaculia bacterium]